MIQLDKQIGDHSYFLPLESVSLTSADPETAQVRAWDSTGRCYFQSDLKPKQALQFQIRGSAGRHFLEILDADGQTLETATLLLKPHTVLACDQGPYAQLAERLARLVEIYHESRYLLINNRIYRMFVTWTRDHVHTLKALKYYVSDVYSGVEYWLETQKKDGMFYDCIHANGEYPGRTWFGEALGKDWFRYDDGGKFIVRRPAVLADTEFVVTEGVWYAWKASGDDAWMEAQLPKLEKALKYNSSDPLRWSKKWGLVKRSFCMDGWDFAHPLFCKGDHRCINKGDPQFLFHGDNSGLYASYWRMAEMYEHLGNFERAEELREEGEAFRQRANAKLFYSNVYGHMIPETMDEKKLYAQVGDERKRMSLATGYTINRKMPTHEMAVKIIDEYRKRGKEHQAESFAEWWAMDPMYTEEQWPGQNSGAYSGMGEYMNGGISPVVAGELAKAAFDHGREDYGVDILNRVWELIERDGGNLHDTYRRAPEHPPQPHPKFQFVDLTGVVNRGLRDKAHREVTAWTGEGVNDMRNLPTGQQKFGLIEFDVIKPEANAGKAVLYITPDGHQGTPKSATIPVANLTGQSVFFLHTGAHSAPPHAVMGTYDVYYADGTVERIHVCNGHETGLWWGLSDTPNQLGGAPVDRSTTRVAWRGSNGEWHNVGLHVFGWKNPHPEKAITAIRVEATKVGGPGSGGLLLAGISVSDSPVEFELRIHSYGLPACWGQAAVYYAIAEGLAGIEDTGCAFDQVKVSPRWSISEADRADVTLHYPASDGYCSYRYALDKKRKRLTLDLTGSFEEAEVHCLLPKGAQAKRVVVDGAEVPFENVRVEASGYADFYLEEMPSSAVVIEY